MKNLKISCYNWFMGLEAMVSLFKGGKRKYVGSDGVEHLMEKTANGEWGYYDENNLFIRVAATTPVKIAETPVSGQATGNEGSKPNAHIPPRGKLKDVGIPDWLERDTRD